MSPDTEIKKAYWVNGNVHKALPISDRGLQYGDGFFSTISVVNFAILNWQAHWHRIQQSCQVLQVPEPIQTELLEMVKLAINEFLQANQLQDCVLKIIMTRGEGGKAYAAPAAPKPNTLFYLKPLPNPPKQQLETEFKVGVSSVMASYNAFQGVKTLNRLENVLARTEAMYNGWQEAVMLDNQQHVVCGSQSNIFAVQNNQIITPPIIKAGVAGTTRWQLIKLLNDSGFVVKEKSLQMRDLEKADELFFTNAVAGVQAVTKLNNTKFTQHAETQKITYLWNRWQEQNALPI